MQFEIDRFLATLYGLTREESFEIISLKKDELMFEISQPSINKSKELMFRALKVNISFLHKLGSEVHDGAGIQAATSIERLRINNVLKNLSN